MHVRARRLPVLAVLRNEPYQSPHSDAKTNAECHNLADLTF
jgi:hypothetical protein